MPQGRFGAPHFNSVPVASPLCNVPCIFPLLSGFWIQTKLYTAFTLYESFLTWLEESWDLVKKSMAISTYLASYQEVHPDHSLALQLLSTSNCWDTVSDSAFNSHWLQYNWVSKLYINLEFTLSV